MLGAGVFALALLIFVVLPAEYGFDPTRVGSKLGLTEMGQIKEHLHSHAEAEAEADAAVSVGGAELNGRLDAIDNRLAAIAQAVGVPPEVTSSSTEAVAITQSETDWRHEADYTLKPGKAIEVKLIMTEGAKAEFEWTANGGVVNHDTHGDAADDGREISYEKGRSVPEHAGELVAAFTGQHGWFWRNRTNQSVVVTLRTRGDYSKIFLP